MVHVMITAGVAQMRPVLPLAPPEEVSRLGKGRYPFAIDQARVPAHVIEVQMRAQHIGDLLCRKAGAAQVLQEGALQVAEHVELPLPVVADAGVDHGRAALRAQHEALEGDDHPAIGRGEVRSQPSKLLHVLRRGVRQQHADVILEAGDFDDARDIDVAHAPLPDMFSCHACPPSCAR